MEDVMGKETKRLGRGLSSLISNTVAAPARSAPPSPIAPPKADQPLASPSELHHDSARLQPAKTEYRIVDPAAAYDSELEARDSATESASVAVAGSAEAAAAPHRPLHLPVDALVPNSRQPRQVFNVESIAALAQSIARNGMLQPLVVRAARPGAGPETAKFELIAGERRWRAARAAGLTEVPVVVREVDDAQALELAIIENIQREDLNAIDRARAYRTYCREFALEPDEVARRLGEDRTTVVNYLRLLDLPDEVKEMVGRGELTMGHARSILGLTDPNQRLDLARQAIARGLSVRALEEVVRRRKSDPATAAEKETAAPPTRQKSANVTDVENQLQLSVGTKVTIQEGRRKGQGKIVLEYYTLDDFDRIAAMLGYTAS
jgi:ParB family chromosome partitioning protein